MSNLLLQLNRDYSAGYGMKPMVAHVCAGTVFWTARGNGKFLKIVVETNPSKNGWQDYLIYYGHSKDEKPTEAITQSHQLYVWFTERWLGLFIGADDE